jgi:hypothetical protein
MGRLSKNSVAISGLGQIATAPEKPGSGFGDVDRSILLAGGVFFAVERGPTCVQSGSV